MGPQESQRVIPFSSLKRILVSAAGGMALGGHFLRVFRIALRLDNGEEIGLGTVSGDATKAQARADLIAGALEQAINRLPSA